ncbi:NfeD family protein [Arthrobacter castelli]|uniref:NfeD family protein n=1 Tax=Arthrobacter castelli TaxID=271431 RepID=UPI000414180A|nr:NfeD family protein [Arthrobacter castelli]
MIASGAHPRGTAAAGSDANGSGLLDTLGSALSSLVEALGLGWDLFLDLILPTLIVAVGGAFLSVWLWRRSRRTSSSIGTDHFTGQIVTVKSAEGTHGQAFVEGSWWSLHSNGRPLRNEERVRVRAVDGLFLIVEPLTAEPPNEEET